MTRVDATQRHGGGDVAAGLSDCGQQQQDGANGLPSKQRRPWTRPDRARHLLRDLIPSVLALHAQTVNVIRSHATVMMLSVISLCRFKSALPAILDALRRNKSREVREACGAKEENGLAAAKLKFSAEGYVAAKLKLSAKAAGAPPIPPPNWLRGDVCVRVYGSTAKPQLSGRPIA